MGVPVVGTVMRKVFGTRNERLVKRYLRVVDQVNAESENAARMSDAEFREKTAEFRSRIAAGESANDILPEVFAIAREAMDRSVGIRNIFNPERNFDPSLLPDDARRLYDEVKATIDSTEPAAPEANFLGAAEPVPAWQFIDIPARLYEAVRELYPDSKPPFRARPFDVQIVGAVVLFEGRIAEMKTGEGKTIVAPLACYLASLEDRQCHVVTVNSYLVQRDRDWTFPFFRHLGLTVGAIHPMHMQSAEGKSNAYACDVVYGTTSEFGFDYLRDNMKLRAEEQVQKHREFAIVDEVDSTLIDEARTPLIISGPAHQNAPRYDLADGIARHLVEKQKAWDAADQQVQSCLVDISGVEGDIRNAREKGKVPELKARLDELKAKLPELEAVRDRHTQFYEVELDKKRASLTHDGIAEAQREANIGSFYVGDNIDVPHLLEQAIRAHTVYQRDRDYVVAPDDQGEVGVIIVDQNTGRTMIGRQWSDGLHQAIESKESVRIKEQTQTMATITIQNFFKMYDRLAGMTGTADTEATEFHEIYKLDVVSIPTNVPIRRDDRQDLVFLSVKDKWDAIIDEIKTHHDIGRPVLVGTTSVEKSESLSAGLQKKHGIQHEVLNAKQHEREADIVISAGQLGAVMIATNMAGRGTDIVLGKYEPNELIDHWKRRGICPKDVDASMPADEIIAAVYRQVATQVLGLRRNEVDDLSDTEIRSRLLQAWAVEHAWIAESKAKGMSDAQLMDALDESGTCVMHRLKLYADVEEMGGLHVVGTERHESRRIDNQLRGRSGRQGDNGSSRFFLSLEDDLMKMFAGKTTLNVLSKLGMKEGDAIEHPMLTRAVEKAQRKVEERNFQIRKNILEYDEPMEHQRQAFYSMRQRVLEGRDVKSLIFDDIEDSVHDAADTYLDKKYVANCVAEWIRENLSVSIEPERIHGKDREDLHRLITVDAKEDAASTIRVTLGEYMPLEDASEPAEWDLKGLADWANVTYKANVKISELRDMSAAEIRRRFEEGAERLIDEADLSPLDQFLIGSYGEREFANWANNKFDAGFKADDFVDFEESEQAVDLVMERSRTAYRKRELTYPIDFALDMTTAGMQQNPQAAVTQFCNWAKARYEVEWTPSALPSTDPKELRRLLLERAEKWDDKRIAERANRAVTAGRSPEALDEWFQHNCMARLSEEELERAKDEPREVAEEKIRNVLRAELTQFERWVVLQIVDQAWKDHLYSMDQVRDAIGFRAFSQRDPRIEFKREAARLFDEMHVSVRDKVTDLIFKARLTPQMAQRAAPTAQAAPQAPAPAQPAPAAPQPAQPAVAAATAMAAAGTATQRRDLEAANRAGTPSGAKPKREPARSGPTIGRNEMVTIQDPSTGKKETMKYKKAQAKISQGWKLVAK